MILRIKSLAFALGVQLLALKEGIWFKRSCLVMSVSWNCVINSSLWQRGSEPCIGKIGILNSGYLDFWGCFILIVNFWSTVCKTVRPMLSVRCLSCLSATFVYCGQTVGRIKMKLGMQVRLGLGHIVLGGNPAPLPQRGTAPQFSTHMCCGQMAAWIKMLFRMKLGFGPGDFC